FAMDGDYEAVELRLVMAVYTKDDDEEIHREAIPLRLAGHPDVRPVSATLRGRDVQLEFVNLGVREATGVLVSLVDDKGAAAATPYVARLPTLGGGNTTELAFALVRGGDRVTVVVEHPGRTERYPVQLRAAASSTSSSAGTVDLSAGLPTVETVPGGTATFELRLENLGGQGTFSLAAEGLPSGFAPQFTAGGTRTQAVTLDGGASRSVTLAVTVPAGASAGPVTFRATVREDGALVGERELTVHVGGAARLELTGRNWFVDVPGSSAVVPVRVRNSGSAAAYDVYLSANAPPGWDVDVRPNPQAALEPGEEAEFELRIQPPAGTSDGRYVLDVLARSSTAVSRERTLTLEIDSPAPSRLPWLLGALLLVGLAVTAVVRIRRR
ncbi:MAG TPA: NEW3 domain-containing protein, partial [Candidatus Thermoplasmatota archaeon]|nr:NEW3 domain-containing protein [Candidatus Thermoplasmatota archaeon]